MNQNCPRVSIVNCVSEALEMLRFSSEQLIESAGTDDFDYIIVCRKDSGLRAAGGLDIAL